MLEEQFWPEVKRLGIKDKVIFIQNSAPPYWSRAVRDWFDRKFPGWWIGRGESVRWQRRSPNLTPCDFFLVGFIKSKSYGTRPRDITELKEPIVSATTNHKSSGLKRPRSLKTVHSSIMSSSFFRAPLFRLLLLTLFLLQIYVPPYTCVSLIYLYATCGIVLDILH